MPIPKDRGEVVRYFTKRVHDKTGNKYMRCEVVSKPGKQGGTTICGPVRTKKK